MTDADTTEPAGGSATVPADQPRILAVRDGGDGWGTVTVEHANRDYRATPCARCPWLKDSPVGAFPAEVFRHSARTAYDLSRHTFGCHASHPNTPQHCAGFLLRGVPAARGTPNPQPRDQDARPRPI